MSFDWDPLKIWLIFVACLRFLAVYLGIFKPQYFRTKLFNLQPNQVSNLYGRTFATWTFVTCALCIICAWNLNNDPIYGATLLSFVVALIHFTTEILIFKTMDFKGGAATLLVAGISIIWMALYWKLHLK